MEAQRSVRSVARRGWAVHRRASQRRCDALDRTSRLDNLDGPNRRFVRFVRRPRQYEL